MRTIAFDSSTVFGEFDYVDAEMIGTYMFLRYSPPTSYNA